MLIVLGGPKRGSQFPLPPESEPSSELLSPGPYLEGSRLRLSNFGQHHDVGTLAQHGLRAGGGQCRNPALRPAGHRVRGDPVAPCVAHQGPRRRQAREWPRVPAGGGATRRVGGGRAVRIAGPACPASFAAAVLRRGELGPAKCPSGCRGPRRSRRSRRRPPTCKPPSRRAPTRSCSPSTSTSATSW